MKRSLKVLITTIVLTVLCVTPVFATESTLSAESAMLQNKMNGFSNDVSTLVTFDNNCGAADILSMHGMVDTGNADVVASNIREEQNYINYLKARVGNAIETERVKKQNIAAIADLCKVNATFEPQLAAAVAEYNQAVVDHALAVQAVADAEAYFAALNASFVVDAIPHALADPQAIF